MEIKKPTLPMPNDAFGSDTVIASCWQVDYPDLAGCYLATLVVLHDSAPFYGVVDISCDRNSDVWVRDDERSYENIVPAAAEYKGWVY